MRLDLHRKPAQAKAETRERLSDMMYLSIAVLAFAPVASITIPSAKLKKKVGSRGRRTKHTDPALELRRSCREFDPLKDSRKHATLSVAILKVIVSAKN